MKATLLTLFVLVFGTIYGAEAAVVIYRGTVREKRSSNVNLVALPPVSNAYVIVDFGTRQVIEFIYFKKGTNKRFVTDTPVAMEINTAPLLGGGGGGTAQVVSSTLNLFIDPGTYIRVANYFRGTNGTITLRTLPTPIQITFPRSLTGYSVFSSADETVASFRELVFALPIDVKATIAANNANRTVQTAYDALLQGLKDKNYIWINE